MNRPLLYYNEWVIFIYDRLSGIELFLSTPAGEESEPLSVQFLEFPYREFTARNLAFLVILWPKVVDWQAQLSGISISMYETDTFGLNGE